jgi:hypothetical protein
MNKWRIIPMDNKISLFQPTNTINNLKNDAANAINEIRYNYNAAMAPKNRENINSVFTVGQTDNTGAFRTGN